MIFITVLIISQFAELTFVPLLLRITVVNLDSPDSRHLCDNIDSLRIVCLEFQAGESSKVEYNLISLLILVTLAKYSILVFLLLLFSNIHFLNQPLYTSHNFM